MENVIEVNGLTKKFEKTTAVDDISFKVKKGEVFGFLISGPPPRPLEEYTVNVRGDEVVVSRNA